MTIREEMEAREHEMLSPLAQYADTARRERPLEPCPIRTNYQRDRDRILHSKAFRRLKHKTQVFLSPEGDHYRTRLTHTLEVAQIARTMARALRLNEDLTEAIALGHDLGHTPFGHAGEFVLQSCCPHGYRHAEQSVRVVRVLENDGKGLNLTLETQNGILCHSAGKPADTLEGRVVRYADKIAYLNHDFEDAVRAGIIGERDVPWEVQYTLGRRKSDRIGALIRDVIAASDTDIRMSPEIQAAFDRLRAFMFEAVYHNPAAKGEEGKAKELVAELYRYFIAHPDEMPTEYLRIADTEDIDRAVCDYLSGMSDRYAVQVYQSRFIPRAWSL